MKSRSRPDRSQRKAKLHKRIVFTNYAVPTGALDHKATEQLIFLLKKLNKEGKTIVVVTHDMEMARSGTKQFYMEDGKIFPL